MIRSTKMELVMLLGFVGVILTVTVGLTSGNQMNDNNQICGGAPRCKQRGMFAPPLSL